MICRANRPSDQNQDSYYKKANNVPHLRLESNSEHRERGNQGNSNRGNKQQRPRLSAAEEKALSLPFPLKIDLREGVLTFDLGKTIILHDQAPVRKKPPNATVHPPGPLQRRGVPQKKK